VTSGAPELAITMDDKPPLDGCRTHAKRPLRPSTAYRIYCAIADSADRSLYGQRLLHRHLCGGPVTWLRFLVFDKGSVMAISRGVRVMVKGCEAKARVWAPAIFGACLTGCANLAPEENELVGLWKSDAEKTLESMRLADGLSEKARRFFEDDFFGHLIAEYRENEARMYFDADSEDAQFCPYRLMEQNDRVFVIEHDEPAKGSGSVTTLIRDGDCYSIEVWNLGFREYFCRVNN